MQGKMSCWDIKEISMEQFNHIRKALMHIRRRRRRRRLYRRRRRRRGLYHRRRRRRRGIYHRRRRRRRIYPHHFWENHLALQTMAATLWWHTVDCYTTCRICTGNICRFRQRQLSWSESKKHDSSGWYNVYSG